MSKVAQANAEYDRLESVRVHRPGFETYLGVIDREPNLFLDKFSIRQAKKEHDRLVETLEEDAEVDVHYLHEDLAINGMIDRLLRDRVDFDTSDISQRRREAGLNEDELLDRLIGTDPNDGLDSYSKLQVISCNSEIIRKGHEGGEKEIGKGNYGLGKERFDSTSYEFREPMTNLYFQRDQQLVTDRGTVLGNPKYSTRRPEVDLVEAAWEAIGADIVHNVTGDAKLEGGDYIPSGEFGLLGVSGIVDGAEEVLRTSLDAGEELLDKQVFGHDEVGLVRAPIKAADEMALRHKANYDSETEMDIMHLDTWFNIADDGLAVGREYLVDNTDVIVYERTRDGSYERVDRRVFGEYLREKGYEIVPVPYEERLVATNFLTLDRGKVLPVCRTDRDGYDPEQNKTIERMKAHGVNVVPNGTGLAIDALRSGYGGIHCMTTPIRRR